MPEALRADRAPARARRLPVQVDGGVGRTTSGCSATRAPTCSSSGAASSARRPRRRPTRARPSGGAKSLARALELAETARGQRRIRTRRSGRSSSRDGEIVGEGATEERRPHGEVVALEAAGERARGATLYVTMEPCAHHGTTPPCVDAMLAAGVARVVAGSLDPNPEAGGGLERLRAAGVDVELADSFEARRQNEAWRTWVAEGRPFVTYKAAITLDGRVTVPGARWVSGEESRRLVHELRAGVGRGRGRHGNGARSTNPRLDARDVGARGSRAGSPSAAGRFPDGSELELRCRPARRGARALAGEGVQSLLLEGGPTLAAAFLRESSSTSCSSSSRRRSPAPGPGLPMARRPARARAPDEPAGRRGRSARGLSPRAVTSSDVHGARPGGRGTVVRSRTAGSSSSRDARPRSGDSVASTASA